MPVDPHIAALLTMLDESGAPPMYEGTPEAGRAYYLALTHGVRTPEQVVPVGSTEDRTVPGADGDLRARVYRPDATGPLPTVLFLHGGGWVIGDLDTHDDMVRNVCRHAEAVVVAVDYRLAPEHPFPAAAEDAVAAARWVARHLGQFLVYPAVDAGGEYPSRVQNAAGYFLEKDTMDWFYGHYAGAWDDARDARLSPLHHADLSGLPPAVVVTAEYDPLRDEGEAYAGRSRRPGGPRTCCATTA